MIFKLFYRDIELTGINIYVETASFLYYCLRVVSAWARDVGRCCFAAGRVQDNNGDLAHEAEDFFDEHLYMRPKS